MARPPSTIHWHIARTIAVAVLSYSTCGLALAQSSDVLSLALRPLRILGEDALDNFSAQLTGETSDSAQSQAYQPDPADPQWMHMIGASETFTVVMASPLWSTTQLHIGTDASGTAATAATADIPLFDLDNGQAFAVQTGVLWPSGLYLGAELGQISLKTAPSPLAGTGANGDQHFVLDAQLDRQAAALFGGLSLETDLASALYVEGALGVSQSTLGGRLDQVAPNGQLTTTTFAQQVDDAWLASASVGLDIFVSDFFTVDIAYRYSLSPGLASPASAGPANAGPGMRPV